jgi:SIR2-like protein
MGWLIFTNRPLLFLGCSLAVDRTLKVLEGIQAELPGLRHYAVIEADNSLQLWEKKEKRLERLGIRPLWFAPGEFWQIEALLRELLVLASTRSVSVARETSSSVSAPLLPEDAIRNFEELFPAATAISAVSECPAPVRRRLSPRRMSPSICSITLEVRRPGTKDSLLSAFPTVAEPDVLSLVRHSATDDRTTKSWAVQLEPDDDVWRQSWLERVQYLQNWGVQVVVEDLEIFLTELHRSLRKLSCLPDVPLRRK